MKKTVIIASCAALVLAATSALAADFGLNMNINVGEPPRPAPAAPAPVPVPATPPAPLPVSRGPVPFVIEEPPTFIAPPNLGFYTAVGVPYDLFYVGSTYFICRDNAWYRGRTYNGPWSPVAYRDLPPGLRRQRVERVRSIRDVEYARYRDDRERYHGKRFRPDKEWKRERREEREAWQDEGHQEKEARKEAKRWEKEERKREKRHRHDRDDD
ncbi:MAG TPA: hypothetical protein VIU40_03135 [Geobacteraceae bacterium]